MSAPDRTIDHTIGPRTTVDLVDVQSGRVLLELPSDVAARIEAAAAELGLTSAELVELAVAERGKA